MKRTHDYTSTQVNLPDDLAASVVGWGQSLIPDQDLYKDPDEPGYGRESEPHVTLLYGLYETNPRKVRYVVEQEKPFDVKLGLVTVFKNERFDVIKIDVSGKGLHTLHAALMERFEHKKLYPVYQPHITVAYVPKGKGSRFEGDEFFKGKNFPVKEIIFSSKSGDKCKLILRGRGNP